MQVSPLDNRFPAQKGDFNMKMQGCVCQESDYALILNDTFSFNNMPVSKGSSTKFVLSFACFTLVGILTSSLSSGKMGSGNKNPQFPTRLAHFELLVQ